MSLLTTYEAAKYLSVSMAFLERDRCENKRIPFVRIGTRAVRYEQRVLEEYVQNQITASASQGGAA